jgi:SAM-dependent methyltransferase
VTDRNQRPAASCPICGDEASYVLTTEDHHYGIPGQFDLYGCRGCRHHFQYPIPTESELMGYYGDDYYAHQPPGIAWPRLGWRHPRGLAMAHYYRVCLGYRHATPRPNPLLALVGWWLYREQGEALAPRWVPNGIACDFGSGSGGTVARWRNFGWRAEGIEISQRAVELGQKAGLNITQGSIEELERRPEAYDFIGSHHCVEHVSDVCSLFRAFYVALKPGGTLAVEVPSADAAAMHVYREAYYYLGLPLHVHLFSRRSLESLAVRNGFANAVAKGINHSSTHARSWLASRDIRKGKSRPQYTSYGLMARAFAKVPALGSILRSIPNKRGDCLVLVCNRPAAGCSVSRA